MNATVAHDDVCGPQTRAELRSHGEQPDSGGPAGGVLTGGGAATADEPLHQTVELLQSVQGPNQLDTSRGRNIRGQTRKQTLVLGTCLGINLVFNQSIQFCVHTLLRFSVLPTIKILSSL